MNRVTPSTLLLLTLFSVPAAAQTEPKPGPTSNEILAAALTRARKAGVLQTRLLDKHHFVRVPEGPKTALLFEVWGKQGPGRTEVWVRTSPLERVKGVVRPQKPGSETYLAFGPKGQLRTLSYTRWAWAPIRLEIAKGKATERDERGAAGESHPWNGDTLPLRVLQFVAPVLVDQGLPAKFATRVLGADVYSLQGPFNDSLMQFTHKAKTGKQGREWITSLGPVGEDSYTTTVVAEGPEKGRIRSLTSVGQDLVGATPAELPKLLTRAWMRENEGGIRHLLMMFSVIQREYHSANGQFGERLGQFKPYDQLYPGFSSGEISGYSLHLRVAKGGKTYLVMAEPTEPGKTGASHYLLKVGPKQEDFQLYESPRPIPLNDEGKVPPGLQKRDCWD